jgi:predicted transposase/invertase (TIGR01784 family)
MIKERVPDEKKAKSFRKFTHNILEIDKPDIDPKVKEAWRMQFRPVDEIVRELDILDAREEGMQKGIQEGLFKAVQTLLKNGLPAEQIAPGIGLSLEELNDFRQYANLKLPDFDSPLGDANLTE